ALAARCPGVDHHSVPGCDVGHAIGDLDDFTGGIAGDDEREAGDRDCRQTVGDPEVEMIEGDSPDRDQDLAGAARWRCQVEQCELFGAAGGGEAEAAHEDRDTLQKQEWSATYNSAFSSERLAVTRDPPSHIRQESSNV